MPFIRSRKALFISLSTLVLAALIGGGLILTARSASSPASAPRSADIRESASAAGGASAPADDPTANANVPGATGEPTAADATPAPDATPTPTAPPAPTEPGAPEATEPATPDAPASPRGQPVFDFSPPQIVVTGTSCGTNTGTVRFTVTDTSAVSGVAGLYLSTRNGSKVLPANTPITKTGPTTYETVAPVLSGTSSNVLVLSARDSGGRAAELRVSSLCL